MGVPFLATAGFHTLMNVNLLGETRDSSALLQSPLPDFSPEFSCSVLSGYLARYELQISFNPQPLTNGSSCPHCPAQETEVNPNKLMRKPESHIQEVVVEAAQTPASEFSLALLYGLLCFLPPQSNVHLPCWKQNTWHFYWSVSVCKHECALFDQMLEQLCVCVIKSPYNSGVFQAPKAPQIQGMSHSILFSGKEGEK